MKKISIIILALVMLLNICGNIYAKEQITEEDLEKAIVKFNSLISSSKSEEKISIKIDKENDQITIINSDGVTSKMKYDLSNDPTFSLEENYKKGMTYDEFKKKDSPDSALLLGFGFVSYTKGVEYEDSLTYIMFKMLEQLMNNKGNKQYIILEEGNSTNNSENVILASEFGDHVIEYITESYNNILINDKDDYNIFEIKMSTESKSEDECKVKSTLKINMNGNFEKLKGYTDNLSEDMENSNMFNNIANIINPWITSKTEEISKDNNMANYIGNSKKLPQTGKEFELVDLLYIIVFAATGTLILLIIKNKKHKNINE